MKPIPSYERMQGRTAGMVAVLLLGLLGLPSPAAAAVAPMAESGVCTGSPADAFEDVSPDSTHAANIDCLAAYGITVGVGGGNYAPDGHVPRAQMTSFLINFLEVALDGELPPPSASVRFSDVLGITHAANVIRAAERGIARGRTAELFEPVPNVTRAQMASFVARTMEVAGHAWPADVPDAFGDDDGNTHELNINRLAHAEVVRGVGPGRYRPDGHITRGQMASFLTRAAALLTEEGLWSASIAQQVEPTILLVSRPGTELDRLAIRWDRAVEAVGQPEAVEIHDANGAPVATATALMDSGSTTMVALDAPLVDGQVYRLQAPADLVADSDEVRNLEASIAFSFTAAIDPDEGTGGEDGADDTDGEGTGEGGGDGTDGGGTGEGGDTGDGGGTDGDGAGGGSEDPAIASVTTSPDANELVVTFDTAVVCPTSPAALSAWSFSNHSIVEDGSHAAGSPNQVVQTSQPSTTCALRYTVDGVEDGDFGRLTYTRPTLASDQVATAGGASLPTTSDVDVTDGKAPEFMGVSAMHLDDTALLLFSEPVACSTISAGQFNVTVDGVPVGVTEAQCGPTASSTGVLRLNSIHQRGQQLAVELAAGTTLSDQSLDNRVPGATRTAVVD